MCGLSMVYGKGESDLITNSPSQKSNTYILLIVVDQTKTLQGVGLGYGRQLYFQCLLKYLVICAFEDSPSIPSFLATDCLHWI